MPALPTVVTDYLTAVKDSLKQGSDLGSNVRGAAQNYLRAQDMATVLDLLQDGLDQDTPLVATAGGTTTSVVDGAGTFVADQQIGNYVIFAGNVTSAIAGEERRISDNSDTTLFWDDPLPAATQLNDEYTIRGAIFDEAVSHLREATEDLLDWIIPKLEDFGAWFKDSAIPGALDEISEGFTAFKDAATPIIETLRDNKDAVFVGVGTAIATVLVPGIIAWTAATWASVTAHIAAAAAWIAAYAPVIAIVGAVAVAAGALYKAWDENLFGIQEKTEALWEFIRPILQSVWDRLSDFIDEVLPDLIATWESLRDNVSDAVSFLWNDIISPIFTSIKDFIEEHSDTIETVLGGVWEGIESTITTVVDVIEGIILGALALIRGDWDEAWEEVKGIADSVWDHIETVFGLLRDFVLEAFEDLTSGAWETVKGWVEDITGFASDLKDDVSGFIGDLTDDVIGFFSDLASDTWETVTDWVDDVVGAAKDLYNDVTGWVSDLVTDTVQFYVDLAKDVWREWSDLVDDVVGAAKDLYNDVTGWISDLVTDTVQFYLDLARDVWESWNNLVDDVVGKAEDLFDDVTGWVSDLFTDVTNYFGDIATDVWRAWEDLVDDLVDKAFDLWDDVTGYVSDLYDDAVGFFEDLRDDADEVVGDLLTRIIDKADDIKNAVLDPFRDARDEITGIVKAAGNFAIDQFNSIGSKIVDWVNKFAGAINWVAGELGLGDLVGGYTWNDIPRLHSGTNNWMGGPAITQNEEMVVLPRNSKVIDAQTTRAMMGQANTDDPRAAQLMQRGDFAFGGILDSIGDVASGAWDKATGFGKDLINKGLSFAMDQVFDRFDFGLSLPGTLSEMTSSLVSRLTDALRDVVSNLLNRVEEDKPAPVEVGQRGDTYRGPVSGNWINPVPGAVLTQGSYGEYSHSGIPAVDLAAPRGTAMYAPAAGEVFFLGQNGWSGGTGRTGMIDHGNGMVTLYGHVSRFLGPGTAVSQGRWIGAVGDPAIDGGFGSGAHLHLEMFSNGSRVMPESYIAFANGGVINEPIEGIGLRSGMGYLMGEAGPERITPIDGSTADGGVTVNYTGPITIQAGRNQEPSEALNDAAWATRTAMRRRGIA